MEGEKKKKNKTERFEMAKMISAQRVYTHCLLRKQVEKVSKAPETSAKANSSDSG